ncbi:MAG: HIT domain-containing protein [Rhodospirillaceae bacterium]
METLDDFKRLIRTTRMSHIYKPVMLQAVLKRRGVATKEEIAADIVGRDVLQHEHYRRNIVDEMPGKRLVRDGALVKDGNAYRLAPPFDRLRESERLELIAECERQIEDFVTRFGDRFGNRNDDPVPGSLRYEVLKRAGGRCELCGASHEEVPLDVDHILPRARGGNNDVANLQVLCRTCNAQKRDRDDTDFQAVNAAYGHRDPGCIFCQKECGEEPLAFMLIDGFPVTNGHRLIIPRRHVADWFDLTGAERNALDRLLQLGRRELLQADPTIAGFNVGINIGAAAGQTVFHVHVHLIPRRIGDMPDPRGGVRGVIPEKQRYLTNGDGLLQLAAEG